ncbi:MAG: asparagine synthase C-terminal domain-containing protein, partial [Desulfovibrionales bacterium]|nr:asparagine synthase C-terminal domain-containing protein [Desulfovibrionales bacterium]
GKGSPISYWDLNFETSPGDLGLDTYVAQGRELLNSAIDLRLRSDVPLGIFLSGGLDSSSVVGLLAPRVSTPLKTFSVAYDFGKSFNETPHARLVARRFKTDHHEFFVTQEAFKDFIPDFVRFMDEPVTEAAAISLYFISKLAKEHVTVVLSGEGSDEIFAGYDFYRYMRILDVWHRAVGHRMGHGISKMADAFLPQGNKLRKYLSLGSLSMEERYKGISTYDDGIKKFLYQRDFLHHVLNSGPEARNHSYKRALFDKSRDWNALNRMLFFDTKTWLVDDLLIKADRMSMAASQELRVPFLDYRLVEFAARLPVRYKIKGGSGKYLLKEMMAGVLPPQIIHRKKMGFPTPLKLMFQQKLADHAREVLTDASCRLHRYFNGDFMAQLVQEHIEKKQDHHRVIWQLMVLEI